MRPSLSETMLTVAHVLANRSTCVRRKVGCVLTDMKGRILSAGYNGVPSGWTHCTSVASECPGAKEPSGEGYEKCQAIHAEQNALLFCNDIDKIFTCYVTTAPCMHCVKMLLNTQCQAIVYMEDHVTAKESLEVWRRAGRLALSLEELQNES